MSHLAHDLRLALRTLASRWRFSALVIATLSVGIGTTVGVFAYLAYFVRPTLDAPEPGRLVWLNNPTPDNRWRRFDLADWRDLEPVARELFTEASAWRIYGASLQSEDASLHVFGTAVSGEYFEILGARPALGRLFDARDDRLDADPVLVLSNLTWRRNFGGDPGVVGRIVRLDGRHAYTIVGVTEPGFQGTGFWAAIHTPLAHSGPLLSRTRSLDEIEVSILARLRAEVAIDEAQSRLVSAAAVLDQARPLLAPRQPRLQSVESFDESFAEEPIYQAARVLMAAVLLLLLLACANVASLMLAHGIARRRETAVHTALGAGRLRVMRRCLLESLLLSGTGGLLGLAFVPPILRLFERYLRMDIPISMGDWGDGTRLIVDERELTLFVAGVSVLVGLISGLAPLLQTTRLDLVASLKGDAILAGRRRLQMRDLLLVVQVALSVVLLVGAALLGRTLFRMQHTPLGFEERGLFLATVYLPKERLNDQNDGASLFRELNGRLSELPGVESASLAQVVPLGIQDETRIEVDDARLTILYNAVGRDYFTTLRIPLLAGRSFDDRDGAAAPRVAVLNRTASAALFPGRTAIGQSMILHSGPSEEAGDRVEIVGVVADSVSEPPWKPMASMVFLPFQQSPSPRPTFVLRGRGPIERRLRELLRAEYPDLAVVNLVPFEEQMKRSLANQRMNLDLSGGLALLGVLLAGFGIFSVTSYTVSQRTREIGIRMALGAERASVGRWVLGEAMRPVGLGLLLGVAGAWVQARFLENQLVGVEWRDPWTLLSVPAVLALGALFAAWLPARKATRVEPIRALRQ
jgi:putative ABC transport system permease protein